MFPVLPIICQYHIDKFILFHPLTRSGIGTLKSHDEEMILYHTGYQNKVSTACQLHTKYEWVHHMYICMCLVSSNNVLLCTLQHLVIERTHLTVFFVLLYYKYDHFYYNIMIYLQNNIYLFFKFISNYSNICKS